MNRLIRCLTQSLILSICLVSMSASASELSPKEEIRFSKAQALNNLKRFEEAARELESLYQKFPGDRKIAIEYAKALGYTQHPDLALQILDRLNSKHRYDFEIFEIRLAILESHQRFDEARAVCAKAIAQDPGSDSLIAKMAKLNEWTAHYDEAISLYEKLALKDPREKNWRLSLADVHFAAGHNEEAATIYESLNLRDPLDFERLSHLGYAYQKISKTEKAIEIFKELHKAHPEHFGIALDLCYFLNQTHQDMEANQLLDQLLRSADRSEPQKLKLAAMLASYDRYERAETLLHEILLKNPEQPEALLWMARLQSWERKYTESLATYDRLMLLLPTNPIPRREKARVLGWTRRFREAIAEYKKIYRDTHDQAVYWEFKSKKDFYEEHPLSALHHYERWLSLEPDNLEALFDLSQIEAQLKLWDHARQHLEKILRLAPAHKRALVTLRYVQKESENKVLTSGYEFREGDSGSRAVDYRIHGNVETLKMPLRENLDLSLTQAFRFHDTAWKSLVRNESGVNVEFRKSPVFSAQGGYSYEVMGSHLPDGQYFFEKLEWNPIDVMRLQTSHYREAILDNPDVIRSGLRTDNYDARMYLYPTRRLVGDAGYRYSHRTDSNERQEWSQGIKYHLTLEPRRLSLSYRYEAYGFDEASNLYFSPDSFHTQTLALEFRHYLNKEELFWGSKNTYYELKYAINFDSGPHEGHRLSTGFYKDWSDYFSTSIAWAYTLYDDPRIYREKGLNVTAKLSF